MPAGGFRRGRRDNGLSAAEYAAVGDVDPRVGEHLLDVLAGEGIAAYLLPATDLHPVTRTTTLPARPTDRLYADREHLGTAREYLARLRAEENADTAVPSAGVTDPSTGATATVSRDDSVDIDAAWASIVAAYETTVDDPTPPWPEAENISARDLDDTDPDLGDRLAADAGELVTRDGAADSGDPARNRPAGSSPDEPTLLDALDRFGADLPDDDEGYTPPPPPPVPRPPAQVVLALVGIVGGLLLFFKPELLPIDADVAQLLGFGALLGGVITLIWRLRPGDEEDDDSDDGAVV
ncbi:DUF308 domain-containing protein [Planosporangium thailandense]|uniref:DUF308 domain-containing protein n=1 Tax=Planosporangium thailandense TaxID=765197 RepID=A0ABX0XUM9_9ACTN|nr:DUF308 domain-containing protein [Planosporangium thailandense]